jgi:hypothetical protein
VQADAEVNDETRDDSDGLIGENAKTTCCRSARTNAKRPPPACNSMVVDFFSFMVVGCWVVRTSITIAVAARCYRLP